MYSLEDLVIFTVDGWFGLYETINTHYWPLPIVGFAWALLLLLTLLKGKKKRLPLCTFGLIALWFTCANVFFLGEYKQLSWVGSYYGWAFMVQACILLLLFIFFRQSFSIQHLTRPVFLSTLPAYCLLISGFLLIPLAGLIEGRNWVSLDIIGTGPDSLALITIAFILLSVRPFFLKMALCIIPTAWLIVSATTAWPMNLTQGIFSLVVWLVILTWLTISFFSHKLNN